MSPSNYTDLLICSYPIKFAFHSTAPSFEFGKSTIHVDYADSGFQKIVAGAAYVPLIVVLFIAVLSRHRFEERSTAVSQSKRVSRPWLRVLQLSVVSFVLRMGWFWADATQLLKASKSCSAHCGPNPKKLHDTQWYGWMSNTYSGPDCIGPVFLTLLNRMGQLTYVCVFAITISMWIAVAADGKQHRCTYSGCIPMFFLVLCTWLMLITAILLGVTLFFELDCAVASQLYQSYIIQVGVLYGLLGVLCIVTLPAICARIRAQRDGVLQAITDTTSVLDDEWNEEKFNLNIVPLGSAADAILGDVASRFAEGIVAVQRTADAGTKVLEGSATMDDWLPGLSKTAPSVRVSREDSDGDIRTALLAADAPRQNPGGGSAVDVQTLKLSTETGAALRVLSPLDERRLATLRTLLAAMTHGTRVIPAVMIACAACFLLRAVMFLWRPLAALYLPGPCCGSIFMDTLCPGAQFTGPVDQYLYPWAFYDGPDIVSALFVAGACASWPDVWALFLSWVPCGARRSDPLARCLRTLGCRARGKTDKPDSEPGIVGAAAEHRMLAAVAISSLTVRGPPGSAWDWPRFRALLRWAGLPVLSDAAVQAQVAALGPSGDAINAGAHDRPVRARTA